MNTRGIDKTHIKNFINYIARRNHEEPTITLEDIKKDDEIKVTEPKKEE